MYSMLGIALLGVFVLFVTPANFNETPDAMFYGAANLVVYDESGNEVFQQTIHNDLVNTGETYILQQVFREGGATDETADANQIAAICIDDAIAVAEGLDADGISDGNNGLGTTLHCEVDAAVDVSAQGEAVIEVSFTAGTNLTAGQTIDGIGICEGNGGTDYNYCNDANTNTGILFAAIETSDITLNGVEVVTITYTFDITSDSS